MTYRVTKFKRWHLPKLLEHGPSKGGFELDDEPATLLHVEQSPNSWSLLWEGDLILCGGTLEQWPGRHTAWAFLNDLTRLHMLTATREAYRIVRRPRGRVEATVRSDFLPGHRWMKLLGFEVETPRLANYGPVGEDHVGYALHNR